MGVDEAIEAARQRERRIGADRGSGNSPSCVTDGERGEPSGKRRYEARGAFAYAERVEASRGEPVLQGRLFEILEPVEARRHPVVRDRHFASDLGIASFVGML